MKTEFLKELGLTEEQIKSVMAENGKDVEAEKEKTKAATAERDNYNTQLTEANKTITDLKKNNSDNETLQTKVKEYEKAIDDQKKENVRIQREAALKVALKGAGCTDEDYFMFKHKDKIEFDENNAPKNLDSLISAEKESKSLLFTTTVIGNPPKDGNPDPTPQDPTDLRSALAQKYQNN